MEETPTPSPEPDVEETPTPSPEPGVEENPTPSPEPQEDQTPSDEITQGDGLTPDELNIETMNDLSIVPFASTAQDITGDCTWTRHLNEDGVTYTLTIVGPGLMADYGSAADLPWKDYLGSITNVALQNGVTTIGSYAFYSSGLKSITIPSSVTTIGGDAFGDCTALAAVTFERNQPPTLDEDVFTGVAAAGQVTLPPVGQIGLSGAIDYLIALKPTGLSGWSNSHNIIDGGYCGADDDGKNVTWALNSDGLLTISGTGKMKNFASGTFAPWHDAHRELVEEVKVMAGVENIGNYAFYRHENLAAITISNSVITLGEYALYQCILLNNVTLPSSVTTLGEYSFYGCTLLSAIALTGIESIGRGAFGKCGLISITIPASVGTIGKETFYECKRLSSVTIESGITAIEAGAFYLCEALTGITIPNSVIIIDNTAFRFSGLESIIIPSSVTTIGKYAFRDCTALAAVTFEGNQPPTLGEEVFTGVVAAGQVTLPPVGQIGLSGAIDYIVALKPTGLSGWSNSHNIIDGSYCGASGNEENVKWALDGEGLLTLLGTGAMADYTDEDAVPWAQHRSAIINVVIENDVTNIGDFAFFGCEELVSITVAQSVTSIGDFAFSGCAKLTAVTIPQGATTIGEYAFYDCTGLISIIIPDKVQSLGEGAFYDCTSLINATLGRDLADIKDATFFNCTSLKNITFVGDGVTSIGHEAFVDSGLNSITLPTQVAFIGDYAFSGCKNLATITIPTNVKIIGEGTFYGCAKLNNITINDGITTIGKSAFSMCNSLSGITIPQSVETIGEKAFSDCQELITAIIGNGVKSLGDSAFYACAKLSSVTIGNEVTAIGEKAFSMCNSLNNITIGEKVTTIGDEAFSRCASLESITLPQSVQTIGNSAFFLCNSLTSIIIPQKVTTIGNKAFSSFALTTIYFKGTTPPANIQADAFDNVNTTGILYYPKGAGEEYTQVWRDGFADLVEWTLVGTPGTLTADTVTRTSHTQATLTFTSAEKGEYTYRLVPHGAMEPTPAPVSANVRAQAWIPINANEMATITLTDLLSGPQDIWLYVKDGLNNVGNVVVTIPGYPTLTATPTALAFGPQTLGTIGTKALTVEGTDLKGDISYQLFDDSGVFTVAKTSWNNTEGGTLTVTFSPAAVQSYTANLTISTTGGDSVVVNLMGQGQKNYCTVDFYSDNTLYTTRTVAKGESLAAIWPQSPTKAKYTFGGWYTQPNGAGQGYTSGTAINTSMNLYAKWIYTDSTIPSTGDEGASLLLWLVTMIFAAGVAFIAITHRRRRRSTTR